MNINVYSAEGQVVEGINVPDKVFNVEPNEHAMYLAVKYYLSNQRQGNRKTKQRSDVSGTNKKPWKQKGRGTARAGDVKSPLWRGGGTIHGPKVGVHKLSFPKKLRAIARKSALTLRCREENILIVRDFNISEDKKTSEVVKLMKNLSVHDNGKVLFVISPEDSGCYRASRNIAYVNTIPYTTLSTYDLLSSSKVVFLESSYKQMIEAMN
jgi:large subunit ribosomal protein L4